jgi:hypothetical protein
MTFHLCGYLQLTPATGTSTVWLAIAVDVSFFAATRSSICAQVSDMTLYKNNRAVSMQQRALLKAI